MDYNVTHTNISPLSFIGLVTSVTLLYSGTNPTPMEMLSSQATKSM